VKAGHVFGLAESARRAPGHQPDRESRRTEEEPDNGAGQGSFAGSLADHVSLFVQIDVAAGKRAPHHDSVVPVVLDERDLVNPRRFAGSVQHVRVGPFCASGVIEDDEREVEAHVCRLGGVFLRPHPPKRVISEPTSLDLGCGKCAICIAFTILTIWTRGTI
jgi:hypothetical protein